MHLVVSWAYLESDTTPRRPWPEGDELDFALRFTHGH